MELAVLLSAGPFLLQKVDSVLMEVLSDQCDGMYEGQPQCTAVVHGMRALGFESNVQCNSTAVFCEQVKTAKCTLPGFGCEANGTQSALASAPLAFRCAAPSARLFACAVVFQRPERLASLQAEASRPSTTCSTGRIGR